MPLPLTFELRLEDRGDDRVYVSVLLAPDGADATVLDGVCLQLQSRTGEALGHRMLLPIAGAVTQPILSTVELRAHDGTIPQGSRVHGSAWTGPEQVEADLPTDPYTELEVHARGRRRVTSAANGRFLEPLLPEERARIALDFPWVDEPRIPPEPVAELEVVDNEAVDEEEVFDQMCDDLGLDEESAEWLKELMGED